MAKQHILSNEDWALPKKERISLTVRGGEMKYPEELVHAYFGGLSDDPNVMGLFLNLSPGDMESSAYLLQEGITPRDMLREALYAISLDVLTPWLNSHDELRGRILANANEALYCEYAQKITVTVTEVSDVYALVEFQRNDHVLHSFETIIPREHATFLKPSE